MPRIRSLKPEHRQHRKIGPLPHVVYRLWIGMICEADDDGRLVYAPEQLRALVFGYHHITAATVAKHIAHLESLGLIRTYETVKGRYICFPSWADHQRIHKHHYTPSKIPDPDRIDTASVPYQDGTSTAGSERIGGERKGSEENGAQAPSPEDLERGRAFLRKAGLNPPC